MSYFYTILLCLEFLYIEIKMLEINLVRFFYISLNLKKCVFFAIIIVKLSKL